MGFLILNGVFDFMVVFGLLLLFPFCLLLGVVNVIVEHFIPGFDICHPIKTIKGGDA